LQIPEALVELLESGVSIFVGTRDKDLRPACARGSGCVVHPGRTSLTVFVPTATVGETLANVRENGEIALGFSRILDNVSLQLKGRATETDANNADKARVERYLAAFSEQLFFAGIPRSLSQRFNAWPSAGFIVEVREMYEQTPGPDAGRPWA
jgi:hypothetical protein